MKSELKDISPTQKELHVEIDGESLKDAYGRVSQKYSKRANVPGFRRGYAPLDVVRMRFREEIKSEVLQDVIPRHVAAAIEEHNLNPLTQPELHLENAENVKVNGSQPVSLHVHVEVMPELPEPKYDGIEVTRQVKPVEDAEIEELIGERLKREAALIPVEERPSEVGDTVVVNLEGRFDDTPDADPITANDLEIVLGDEVIESSFTDNLIGVRPDEEKEFTVAYPDTFSSEGLAGKTVHYKAKVKSVGRTELPEMNDEWAQSLEEGYSSLADLRERLTADLKKFAEADANARVRNTVVEKFIENNAFEVPATLIENRTRGLLNEFVRDLQQREVDVSALKGDVLRGAYENIRIQAERDVRGALLLERVAEAEKLDVSEAEIDDELEKMASYYRASKEEIRESLEKQDGGLDNIKSNLRTRKAIEAVVAKVNVNDGPWVGDDKPNKPQEEKPKKAAKPKKAPRKATKKAEA